MPINRWGIIALLCFLTSCSREPEAFAPPPQRKAPARFEVPYRLIAMSDSTAESHIVRDVATGPAESWRWAGRNPTFRAYLGRTNDIKYHLEFTIAEATFKETGPVTVRFLVNDKEIGRQRCVKPGSSTWEAPVDPAVLNAGAENTFGASVDKVWTSPQDKSQLGLIISTAGLVH